MTYQRNETPEPLASDEPRRLLQDEDPGRDGKRLSQWFASRPDARLRAREAAEADARERTAL